MDAIRVAKGVDRPGQDRQGRGRLPRASRRSDDLDETAARRRWTGGRTALGARHGRHHQGHRRRHDRHPLQRRRCARPGARLRRSGLLHRRAGDGEHRHLPPRAGLPGGGARDHAATRDAAHLRRGEDRDHRGLWRCDGPLRDRARPRDPGQVDRGWASRRRVRWPAGVHGSDHPGQGPPPRDVQRQPAGDGGERATLLEACTPEAPSMRRSPATATSWRPVRRSSTTPTCPPTRCGSAPRDA